MDLHHHHRQPELEIDNMNRPLELIEVYDLDLLTMSMVLNCDTFTCQGKHFKKLLKSMHAWLSLRSPDTTTCSHSLFLIPVCDLCDLVPYRDMSSERGDHYICI